MRKFELQAIMLSSQSSSSSSVTSLDTRCCCCDDVLFSSGNSTFKGSREVKTARLKIWKQFHTTSVLYCFAFNAQLTVFKHDLSFLKNSKSYSNNSFHAKLHFVKSMLVKFQSSIQEKPSEIAANSSVHC